MMTLLIDGTLIVALTVVSFAAPRDARDAGINGAVGLTLSADGTPILLLQVCRGSVDRVSIVGPNRGNTPNETIAELASPVPITGSAIIDPSAPPSGWTGKPVSLPSQARRQLLLIALVDGHQSQLRQVSFTAADLAALAPGTVLYSVGLTNRRVNIAGFRGVACN